jgi:peptidoglycan/xylan/chitin deacetylase (PgdA/CDA1 family)
VRILVAAALVVAALAVAAAVELGRKPPAAHRRDPHAVRATVPPVTRTPGLPHRRAAAVPLRLPHTLPHRTIVLPILMYHRVGPHTASLRPMARALTVTAAAFAQQMRWIVARGYHPISQRQAFDALERNGPLPRRPLMITFDDGYRDVLWNAMPVLSRLHLPATAYVITSRVSGSDLSFLTWDELRQLERNGVAIGSHTVHHTELPLLSDPRALYELRASRQALEQRLHHPVQWFSYPAGRITPHAARLVRAAGYVLAVTTQPGSLQRSSEPLSLHRDEVLATTSLGDLSRMLASHV